jgi:hypothetical protein
LAGIRASVPVEAGQHPAEGALAGIPKAAQLQLVAVAPGTEILIID